jgi:hypothetical protein
MLSLLAVNLAVWHFTSTVPLSAQTCAAPPAGLVVWWSGDGHFFDLAGTNHGVPSGNVSFATGKVGPSFSFDGLSQFVRIPNSASLNPPASFSIEAWVYPTRTANQIIFAKWGDAGDYANQRSYTLLLTEDNAVQFAISDAANQLNTGFHVFNTPADSIPLNAWTHVVGVYDQSTGTRRIYINGVTKAERTDAPITVLNGGAAAGLGAYPRQSTVAAGFFEGQIDEVSFYHRGLSSNEVVAIHAAGSAGKCRPPFPAPTALMSWWPAEDNFLGRVGPNHGTPMGAVGFVPGKVGRAFDFNGVDSYIVAPPILTNAAAFTFEWWMKVRSFTHPKYMATFSQSRPTYISSSPGFNFYVGNGGASFGFQGLWTDGTYFDLRTDIPFGTGVWKHVAVTYDGTVLKQFVDGALLNQGNYADKTSGNAHPFFIGKGYAYPGGVVTTTYFDGQIDEFSVYRRALGSDEVAAIHAAGSAGKALPPTLTASLTAGGVLLSWPAIHDGFGLVSCSNLAAGAWEVVTNAPSLNGTRKEVLVPAATPSQRFFRLQAGN